MDELRESSSGCPQGEYHSSSNECMHLPNEQVVRLSEEDEIRFLSISYGSDEDLRPLDVEEDVRESDTHKLSPRGVLEGFEAHTVSNIRSPWWTSIQQWRLKSIKRFSTIPHIGIPKLSRRGNRRRRASQSDSTTDADFCLFKPSWRNFTISELEAATNYFSQENIIGKGGYAEVYKGCIEDGQNVAVKRLNRGTSDEQVANFLSEVGVMVHVNHPNTAKLIGFGVDGGMHLVFQLSPHGSLASLLHGPKERLDWIVRYKVAIGTAEGLHYLHEKCQRCIVHRDIKAANILLTEDFEPQICDFGLAKWLPDKLSHHTMLSFEGTFGYLAPEYLTHGIVDEKTDVFAFGVLLLELITGRKALDSSQHSLVMWARPLLEKNDIGDLVDPCLGNAYDHEQLCSVAKAASICTQQSHVLRPRMTQVLNVLKGNEGKSERATMLTRQKPSLHRTYSVKVLGSEEYSDLRPRERLVMGLPICQPFVD